MSEEILYEWVERHQKTRERYRLVEEEGVLMLYRRREKKVEGEWKIQPNGISVPDSIPEEEVPDYVLNGWEDVPADFQDVAEDAQW